MGEVGVCIYAYTCPATDTGLLVHYPVWVSVRWTLTPGGGRTSDYHQ